MSKQSRSKGKWNLVLAALVAVLICMSSATVASALGVTPGRKTIDFVPGIETTGSFTIKNNDNKAFTAYIYVEGALKDYITFDQQVISFEESESAKGFTYKVKLPERLDPPGDHWGKIVVMELPPDWESSIVGTSLASISDKTVGLIEYMEDNDNTQVVATVAVIHQVRVKVPYPGKYMRFDLTVQEAVPNESVKFVVKMYNLGKEDIAKAQATIEILGPTNEVIAAIETEAKAVKSMERGELIAVWKAQVNPGMYHAKVTVRYDGETGGAEKNFYVGNMLVDVLGVSVKDFRLGGIAKFDIEADSKWNQPIPGVYAHMVVNDQQENKVADFKSASVDMEPFERTHLYAYWDTEGVLEGDYISRLTLHYAGRKTEREIKTRVGLDAIRTEILGVSVGAVTAEGPAGLEQYPMIMLVAVLIAINLGWFLYFRKRKG
jgi:hypothetical protein